MRLFICSLICGLAIATCQAEKIASVAEATKRVQGGFRGEVQISAYYFFHPEEDILCDTAEPLEGAYIQLVFLPLLNDVPQAKRYEARLAIAKKLNGKLVVISGVLKKGVIDERLTTEYPLIEVSKIEEEANQRPERNTGATSSSTSTPPPGVAHP